MKLVVLAAAVLAAAGLGSAYATGAFGSDARPHPAAPGGAMPDLKAIGTPEPLSLSAGTVSTKDVPCAGSKQHVAGPDVVRNFHAVTAVSCIDGNRTYPGQGQWWVRIRRVAVGSVAGLQRYFEQPSQHNLPQGGFCDDVARATLVPTLVDQRGHWLVPRVPTNGCGDPLAGGTPKIRWRAVSVHKLRLMVSAAALAAHCAMGIKDLPAGGIGPLTSTSGGPLFKVAPTSLRVCIYRTRDFEVGTFVRGFSLSAAQTSHLLGALTRAAPSTSCPDEPMFAVVYGGNERWAEVELGGCWRVGRTYPDYGMGGSDSAVVREILGSG